MKWILRLDYYHVVLFPNITELSMRGSVTEMLAHVHVRVNVQQTAHVCIVYLVDQFRVGWHLTYAEELLVQCLLVGSTSLL